MTQRAVVLLLALAACSPEAETAGTTLANESMAATPARMVAGPQDSSPAKRYADATAAYNSFERAAGTLGREKASRPAVKKYAEMLYKEHLQFGMTLKLASAQVAGLMPNPTLTAEQQRNLDALQAANGDAFDRLFIAQQLAAHAAMLPQQQRYAASGDEPALRAFADRYSRWVQRHLRLGREL